MMNRLVNGPAPKKGDDKALRQHQAMAQGFVVTGDSHEYDSTPSLKAKAGKTGCVTWPKGVRVSKPK